MAFKVQVQAYDSDGNTSDSAVVTTNYPPPETIGAVAITSAAITEGTFSGAWTYTPVDEEDTKTGFLVWLSTEETPDWENAIDVGDVLSYNVPSALTGTIYFAVRAVGSTGLTSEDATSFTYTPEPEEVIISPVFYGRPEIFKLRYYNRNDLTVPVLVSVLGWYAQGRIRVIPLRLSIETTSFTTTASATDTAEEVFVTSTSGVLTGDRVKFPSGEIAEVLAVETGILYLARGINAIFAPVDEGDLLVLTGAPISDITLTISEDDDELSEAIVLNQWFSIKRAEDETYTPLGEFIVGHIEPGDYVDLDLQLYIPPYDLNEEFCATDRITFPVGESFLNLETTWSDPNQQTSLFGDFLFFDRLYGDTTQKTPPGNYHRPVLQVNYYDADEVAFLEANGVEFPGDSA